MHSIEYALIDVGEIKPNPHNARTHSKKQLDQIDKSVDACGFVVPVGLDENSMLIFGHARLQVAKRRGLKKIPAIRIRGLSEAKKRALMLADNKIATNAGWDRERLALELPELADLLIEETLDISLTGFEPAEIDQLVTDFEENTEDPADSLDTTWLSLAVLSRPGDFGAFTNKHEYDRVIADAKRAIQLDPKSGPAFVFRAEAYLYLGKIDEALVDANEAVRVSPEYALAYNVRGKAYAYYTKKDFDRALTDFNKAIELDPGLAAAYASRGNAYWLYSNEPEAGDKAAELFERALADFSQAIKLNPMSAEFYRRRAYANSLRALDCIRGIDDFNESFARRHRLYPAETES